LVINQFYELYVNRKSIAIFNGPITPQISIFKNIFNNLSYFFASFLGIFSVGWRNLFLWLFIIHSLEIFR
jgi:hypothetical protein